jgi:hypothetical protein
MQKSLAILAHNYNIHHFNSVTRTGNNLLYDRESICNDYTVATHTTYKGADKSLAWPTSRCILFDG